MKRILLLFTLLLAFACNKDGEVTIEVQEPPVVHFDSPGGVYTVKVGRELRVAPSYENVREARYAWTCDGVLLSDSPSLTHTFDRTGTYYVRLEVSTAAGSVREEIRIEVTELTPPVISLALPDGGLTVEAGREYRLSPDYLHADDALFRWTVDGETVSTGRDCTLLRTEVGDCACSLQVENEDGYAEKEFTVHVVERLPVEVVFVPSSLVAPTAERHVAVGRQLCLRPYIGGNAGECTFSWNIDGEPVVGADAPQYAFTLHAPGNHTVTFTLERTTAAEALTRNVTATGTERRSFDIPVVCYAADQAARRPFGPGCSVEATTVYEFIPAPGQFVNETLTGGYAGEATHDAATAYAERRLGEGQFVSLGAWGGRIVVGFDHSIENRGGYDFSITGNATPSASEPGIVFVMQDTNGNGLPDDEWYELRGSEFGGPDYEPLCAVTYYRPGGPGMATQWTDGTGRTGRIDYLETYHAQPYYYPAWIERGSYTLYGPRLAPRTSCNASGLWINAPFGWGYADNAGEDAADSENPDAEAVKNRFRISDAVYPDGSPADLDYIDFIMVQTAVQSTAGYTGEVSTEVFGFTDENNRS